MHPKRCCVCIIIATHITIVNLDWLGMQSEPVAVEIRNRGGWLSIVSSSMAGQQNQPLAASSSKAISITRNIVDSAHWFIVVDMVRDPARLMHVRLQRRELSSERCFSIVQLQNSPTDVILVPCLAPKTPCDEDEGHSFEKFIQNLPAFRLSQIDRFLLVVNDIATTSAHFPTRLERWKQCSIDGSC
ncbi:hypothetical protein F4677DRAFT_291561 [Hypoxylon crocopeplum]|nr:hypothetical protein F4677DRAFT_291561 [Hypoxylon crocopeplum]